MEHEENNRISYDVGIKKRRLENIEKENDIVNKYVFSLNKNIDAIQNKDQNKNKKYQTEIIETIWTK